MPTDDERGPAPQRRCEVNESVGFAIGQHNKVETNFTFNMARRLSRRAAFTILACACAVAIAAPLLFLRLTHKGPGTGLSPPSTIPLPASDNHPPVIVENVSELTNLAEDGSLALARPLRMTAPQLAAFNNKIQIDSARYAAWSANHGGAALNFGVTSLTLRGNAPETVRIADMSVMKTCTRPYDGTYFQGYTQGSGQTVRIGFDLDAADPVPQQMGFTGDGLTPLGVNFFTAEYISLRPGETITLTVGAFTRHYSCSFSLRMLIATSAGTYYEDIDDHGRPFVVTAVAPPVVRNRPLSGYQAAYAYLAPNGEPTGWALVNPATYRKAG